MTPTRRNVVRVAIALSVACGVLALVVYLGMQWDLSKSDWAAWVQAVGSVGAIFVALWVVRVQHARDALLRSESERRTRRSQLVVLRWTFLTVAESCDVIAKQVHDAHIVWQLQAQVVRERRRWLTSVAATDYPDASLLLRARELAHLLQMTEAVVDALKQPRSEDTRNHVAGMLGATRESALVGVTEATSLLVACSSPEELKTDWVQIDAREKSRDLTLKVLAELRATSSGQ
jgi:hypothetical protein